MHIQKEREAFDVYFKGKYPELYKDVFDKDGDDRAIIGYSFAWSAWQAAKAQAVPDGFVVVPKKPTWGMIHAGEDVRHSKFIVVGNIYKAMIEAQEQAND